MNYTVTEDPVANYSTQITKAADGTFTYTVKNSRTTEKTQVSVEKIWNDSNNAEGFRPENVTVKLLANGKETGKTELNEKNEWKYTWTGLNKYADGKEIVYTVAEDQLANYKVPEIKKVSETEWAYTVTNSRDYEKTEIKVTKAWDDKNDQDGKRPAEIKVTLKGTVPVGTRGETEEVYSNTQTIKADAKSDWSYKWTDLAVFAKGQKVSYAVTEAAVDDYTASIDDITPVEEEGVITGYKVAITNRHKTEETEVNVTKVWNDADDQDGYRPDDVTVNLLANGEVIDTVTLSEENSWSYGWTKLDKKAAGKDIDYTVTEDEVSEYTTQIEKADDGTFTYTIINSHETEETEVNVTKVWNDADDQDGYRPDDVTVNLLADGNVIDTVTLSEENSWSYGWTKLDKKAAGQEIDYTVTEDTVDKYTTQIDKAADGTFTYTVTNSHTTDKTEASVKKVWDITAREEKKTPDSLKVTLLADGKETGMTVELNEANGWTGKITELPKYRDHGTEIVYTWSEDKLPDGYALTGTSEDGTVTTLTNTYTVKPCELPLEATKILTGRQWTAEDNFEFTLAADEGNPDGAVLPEVKVKTADINNKNVVFDKIVFNKYGTFKFTITETEGHIKGVTYDTEPKEFTVVIKDDGKGTLFVDSVTNDGYVDIKNPYDSKGEIQFFAKKVMNGRQLTEGAYSFELKDENGQVLQTVACDAEGKVEFAPITYTEEDMLVNGAWVEKRQYTYTISEVKPEDEKLDKAVIYDGAVKEITVTLTDDQEGTITTDPATGDLGITFINTVVRIQKTDAATGDELTGAHLQVLDQTGTVVDEWDTETGKIHEVKNLKIDEEYTLTETIAPKDYAFAADATFTVDRNGKVTSSGLKSREDGTLLLEDKLAEKPKFEKKIKDTNDTTGETSGWQDSADYDIGDAVPYQLKATLADNVTDYLAYHITFHDVMEKGLTFNGIDMVTVNGEEVKADKYTLTADEHSFDLTLAWGDGTQKITDTTLNKAAVEVYFTAILNKDAVLGVQGNVNTGKLEYSCNPNVNGEGKPSEDTEETKEDSVIAFTYKAEVNKVDEIGDPLAGAEFKLEKILPNKGLKLVECVTAESGDMFTFKGLDDGDYILTETKHPEGYKAIDPITFTVTAEHTVVWEDAARDTILTSLTGTVTTGELTFATEDELVGLTADVKNESELTSASVKKIWKDDENRDGLRPVALNIELLADGAGTGKFVKLDASNNWLARIDGLPRMKNGKPVTYTWKEPSVVGYTLTNSKTTGTLTTLTNSYGPAETEVNVRKIWADSNNEAKVRPENIKVQLYADGQAFGTAVTLDAANNWSYSWTGLKKNVNEAGLTREIRYTVAETAIPEGYTAKITGNASTGYVITNTYESGKLVIQKEFDIEPWEPFVPDDSPMDIPVTKTWNDNDNKDGNRPGAVTVRLLADGKEVANAQLSEANGWKNVFTGLPRMTDEKVKIEYTIIEDPVDWYEAEIHGFNIRNNYKPVLTSVTVRKLWNDNNDAKKLRPTSIAMTLSNGMSVVLSAQNHWTATIDNLPTRVNGQPVTYTWTEQQVISYNLTDVVTENNVTTFTNTIWTRPEPPTTGGRKPKTPGETVEVFEEYETPLGVEVMINHVGDCFD